MLNIDSQRLIDRVVGPPICWFLTLLQRGGRERQPPDVRKILVVLLSEMGALVLTRPMFDRLREKFPGVRLLVLCSEQNRAALDLLELVAPDDIFVVRNRSVGHFAADSLSAIRRVRAIGIDAVIDAELFARASAIYSGLSGAPIRVGFHRHTQEGLYRGDFINRRVLYNPYRHIAEQFVSLAEAIDSPTVPRAKRVATNETHALPPLALRPGELETMRQRLHERFQALRGKRLVFLCPGAGLLPIRAWPASSYAHVARELSACGFAVAVIGLPEDRDLGRTILEGCPADTCVNLAGYTATVRDVTVLLHLGELLIANDGGTGHFAALTPIPAIVLFGPETPVLYGSLATNAVNVFKGLTCSPCLTAYNHRRSPCDGDNVCLKSIAPEEVLAEAYRLLGVSTPA